MSVTPRLTKLSLRVMSVTLRVMKISLILMSVTPILTSVTPILTSVTPILTSVTPILMKKTRADIFFLILAQIAQISWHPIELRHADVNYARVESQLRFHLHSCAASPQDSSILATLGCKRVLPR